HFERPGRWCLIWPGRSRLYSTFPKSLRSKNWPLAFQKRKGTTSIAAEHIVARDNLLPFRFRSGLILIAVFTPPYGRGEWRTAVKGALLFALWASVVSIGRFGLSQTPTLYVIGGQGVTL